jgi:hypothetical protein
VGNRQHFCGCKLRRTYLPSECYKKARQDRAWQILVLRLGQKSQEDMQMTVRKAVLSSTRPVAKVLSAMRSSSMSFGSEYKVKSGGKLERVCAVEPCI